MPVPVAGKIPLGGTGWNLLPLETRLQILNSESCTGIGIQMGLIFHPVLGPVDARTLDCDIDSYEQRNIFAGTLHNQLPAVNQWRWGRRPATIIFTQPNAIKQEKFGPIQLLGAGKQIVYWGEYQNKSPLSTDPKEYWHQGPSIFDVQPPFIMADALRHGIETSLASAGFPQHEKSMLIDATPLSDADIAMLGQDSLATFQRELKSMLFDVQNAPTGSGRGTKLHHLGVRYGALIKASGTAPMLTDAARSITKGYVEFSTVKKHAFLADIGATAEATFAMLPGSLTQGDRRDFARGVGASMGLSQGIEVSKAKNPLVLPTGRDHPGQTAADLMRENLAPQRFLINKYLVDHGCIILAGKPKIGKGWIILEMGLSIAEGGKFWFEDCDQAEVLMYMLEDGPRRLKNRLTILRPDGFNHFDKIRFRYSKDGPFDVNSNGTGTLLDDIRKHLISYPAIRFVVVDVLQRVRGTIERSDNAYQVDYKIVGAIQKLAAELNVLIIVVHHTKKGKVDDAIDSINGSYGVIGAADGGIIIGKSGDVIMVESRMRDIPEFDFEMVKEDNGPMWKPAITGHELSAPNEGTKAQSVLMALHAGACALTAGDLAKRTGITEKNVATYLGRLMKNDQVTKPSRGFYVAVGLPYRERIKGVIDVLKRCPKIRATNEVKAQYAPNSAPPEATYMILTEVAIREIEGSFVNGKDALMSLKHRSLASFNSDTVWLIGDDWEETPRQAQPNPFSFRMPWEVS